MAIRPKEGDACHPFRHNRRNPDAKDALEADTAFRALKANLDALSTTVPMLYKKIREPASGGGALPHVRRGPGFSGMRSMGRSKSTSPHPPKKQRYLGEAWPGGGGVMCPSRPRSRWRAVFLSDVHLGSRHTTPRNSPNSCPRCAADGFTGRRHRRSVVAGAAPRDRGAHNRVVEALYAHGVARYRVVYIPGNHDRPVRRFCGLVLPAIMRRRVVHTTADGRRHAGHHGDEFDNITHFGGLQEKFGDWLYYRILSGNCR